VWYNIEMGAVATWVLHLPCTQVKDADQYRQSPLEYNMNELLLKIEYEIYWASYLHWVYSESPIERKPEYIHGQRNENIFKEND
jgi:hypothetical protein